MDALAFNFAADGYQRSPKTRPRDRDRHYGTQRHSGPGRSKDTGISSAGRCTRKRQPRRRFSPNPLLIFLNRHKRNPASCCVAPIDENTSIFSGIFSLLPGPPSTDIVHLLCISFVSLKCLHWNIPPELFSFFFFKLPIALDIGGMSNGISLFGKTM